MKFKYKNDLFHLDVLSWIKLSWSDLLARNSHPDAKPFYSTHYEFYFSTWSEYWAELGKRQVLIESICRKSVRNSGAIGFNTHEVMQRFARTVLGQSPGVVLYDLRMESIGQLIDRFPDVDRSVFLRGDAVVLLAKNKDSARKLVEGIPTSMAEVLGFHMGECFISNGGLP